VYKPTPCFRSKNPVKNGDLDEYVKCSLLPLPIELYAVNFAAELLCLQDSSYVLTGDVVFSKDELNDLLSTARCD